MASLNLQTLPVKASYFFILGGVASLLPFLAIYMRQASFSTMETAIIYGLMPFIGAFVRPIVGAAADAWKKHKLLLVLCCVLTGVFHCLLLAVPHHKYDDGDTFGSSTPAAVEKNTSDLWTRLQCEENGSTVIFCPREILLARGCTENPTNLSSSTPDPLGTMRNCSLDCKFDGPTNATRLCLHQGASATCPLNRPTLTGMFTDLPDLHNKGVFRHLFHHILRGHFIGVHFELENLPLNTRHWEARDGNHEQGFNLCYKYTMQRFLFDDEEYTEQEANSTVVTCDAPSSLRCFMDCDVLPDLDSFDSFTCPGPYHPLSEENTTSTEAPPSQKSPFDHIFWMFFLISLIAQMTSVPILSLNDGIVYDYLGELRNTWGRQRLWGTVGFIVFALISGVTMDVFSKDHMMSAGHKNYTPAFVIFLICFLISGVLVCFYKISPNVRANNVGKEIITLLFIPDVLIILTVVTVFGIYTGVIETFLYWHLIDLGAPQSLLSLCILLNCLPEIIILLFASPIISKLGHVNCLYLTFVAYAVRMTCYALVTKPWKVLLVEPLHGITFGLMYAAASAYGSEMTPDGLHGCMQGLIGGLHFGIGKGIGSLSGGWMCNWLQFHQLFGFYAVSALVLLLIYFAFNLCLNRWKHQRREKAVPTVDGAVASNGNGAPSSGGAAARELDEIEPGRLSALYDDYVTFDKDKQALVFKDDPDV